MHARELVELAALVAAHGAAAVGRPERISDEGLREYWIASKSRLDRWGWALKRLTRADGQKVAPNLPPAARVPLDWPALRAVLEEIITGEVLARVWTAAMHAHDRLHGTEQAEPIARSVLMGHLEARCRVLTLLVGEPRIAVEHAVKLNRLRCRAERWTDLLIGWLSGLADVSQFAAEPDRARDFAHDLRDRNRGAARRLEWSLLLASLRASFRESMAPSSPNGDLNARIAAAVLSCLQPEWFEGTALVQSAWLTRLASVADNTEGMIRELVALDKPAPQRPAHW